MRTTVGQLIVNESLPEDLRDYSRRLDKKGIKALFRQIAERYPDQYRQIAQQLMLRGRDVSHWEGSSIKLEDLKRARVKARFVPMLQNEIRAIAEDDTLSQEAKDRRIVEATHKLVGKLDEAVLLEGLGEGNALSIYADSGTRGSKSHVNQLRGSPLMVLDHRNDPIPVPIISSFSEGLDPVEAWATSYGVRKGFVDVKQCLAAGTAVLMGDGAEKPIEQIKQGDIVMGADLDGSLSPVKVLQAFDNGSRVCHEYVFRKNRSQEELVLVATEDHNILAQLKQGRTGSQSKWSRYTPEPMPLKKATNHKNPTKNFYVATPPKGWVRFKSWTKKCVGPRPTYDLHVDNRDHLFVLANGLIVSNSTPKAGYFGKQLANASHRLIVSDRAPMAGTGLPVDAKDPDNEGSVLARDYPPYKAGTVLTPKIIRQIARRHRKILVHSPISAVAPGGGVPRIAAGYRERAGFSPVGENIGIAAAQAISEPLAQSAISSKHIAGVKGAGGKGATEEAQAGFDVVNRLANIPKSFQGKATVATTDGSVSKIEPAPQGGHYVYVVKEKHYVPPERRVTVKTGDRMEAGDSLTDGIPSPADVVKYKGVGEGRRYFMQRFYETLQASGVPAHRRNVELIARALINHVRITGAEGLPGSLPDDIVEYDDLASKYVPRRAAQSLTVDRAKGKYLEQPTLHYSVGTRITPRVMKTLKQFDVKNIMVHADPPNFVPEMQRAIDVTSRDPDWMVRLGGFQLKKHLLESLHRGAKSELAGTSYIPALARGAQFGTRG